MWETGLPDQRQALLSLVRRERPDCLLVAECGGRLRTHSLLLALHSPALSRLLAEADDKTGLSLPFPLPTLTCLVAVLHGEKVGRLRREVADALDWLGVSCMDNSNGVKMEVSSGEDDWDEAKEEDVKAEAFAEEKYEPKKKQKGRPSKRKVADTSSDEDSDEDGNDPDYSDHRSEDFLSENGASNRTPDKGQGGRRQGAGRKRTPGSRRTVESSFEFPCDKCEKRLRTAYFRKKHQFDNHGQPLACDSCDYQTSVLKEYKKHMKNSHPKFACEMCGVKKKSGDALRNHIEAKHTENLPCPECGIVYKTKVTLNQHIVRVHNEKNLFQCSECEYKTNVKGDLKVHFERRHTEIRQVTCQFCGGVFKNLKNHLDRTGCGGAGIQKEKVPCDQCQKTFYNKYDLDAHVKRIHDAVRDKRCTECSYTTYKTYNLRLHMAKAHFGTGLVKESCPHCDKETTNLAHHIMIYHGAKIVKQQ